MFASVSWTECVVCDNIYIVSELNTKLVRIDVHDIKKNGDVCIW